MIANICQVQLCSSLWIIPSQQINKNYSKYQQDHPILLSSFPEEGLQRGLKLSDEGFDLGKLQNPRCCWDQLGSSGQKTPPKDGKMAENIDTQFGNFGLQAFSIPSPLQQKTICYFWFLAPPCWLSHEPFSYCWMVQWCALPAVTGQVGTLTATKDQLTSFQAQAHVLRARFSSMG